MTQYWSDFTRQLQPYVPGEQPQDQQYIKLNTNESPFAPSPQVIERIVAATNEALRLYPDPNAAKLKKAIADYYSIDAANVFVGNGSDEVLALSFMAFFKKDKAICFPSVSYSFYPVYCKLYEIDFNCFELNANFEIELAAIPENNGGIIFPNPNAPTSLFLDLSTIEALLQKNKDVVVIVDEAYIDFGGTSCISLIDKYPNLLIIQTLSKSRSLAGLRVGFAMADPNLILGLERVKNSFNSYPLDMLAIEGAVAAIQDQDYFQKCCEDIISVREWLSGQLKLLSFTVLASKTNFLFVSHATIEASELYQELKKQGVLVRYFNQNTIDNYLRITIATRDEMEIFLQKIKTLI